MGRNSRRKAERREGRSEPTAKERQRSALKRDRRGRRVATTVEDYERVADLGADRLAEALISRHSVRMENIAVLPELYRVRALESIVPVVHLDLAHMDLNLKPRRLPFSQSVRTVDLLSWGVGSCIAAARLLLAGQVIGAATIARQQLEFWTRYLASVGDLDRSEGESVQHFVARCWSWFAENLDEHDAQGIGDFTDLADGADLGEPSSADEPDEPHEHILLANGTEICPAVVYGFLSEIMHADECRNTMAWEVVELLAPEKIPSDAGIAVGSVSDALSLCLIQIKIITAARLKRQGNERLAQLLLSTGSLERFSEADEILDDVSDEPPHPWARRRFVVPVPDHPVTPPLATLMPLLPNEGLASDILSQLARRSATYAALRTGRRPAGRLYRDDELATLAFLSHRHEAARAALEALQVEKRVRGEDFKLETLGHRGVTIRLIAEVSGLCAMWSQDQQPPISSAAALIASSLRSAHWLWLEDDDCAMATLRCTLEQTARLKVSYQKPDKARKLEASAATMPKDWLNAAGWKRLSALNRALGEFAHAHTTPRWNGARNLLAALQIDADPEHALFTARGATLDLVATIVAREVVNIIENEHSVLVGATARALLVNEGLDMSRDDHALNSVFDHIWKHRATSLMPDTIAVTADDAGE